jgi:serine/threonine-protein kinase RsbW
MTSPGTSPGNDLGTGPRVRDPFPRWRRVFAGRDDQVREVRRWLTRLLPGAPERDDVVVVAVELVTNAIRHTASGRGGLVMVEVAWCGPVLRVAVADGGAPDGPRLAPGRAGLADVLDAPAGLAPAGLAPAELAECGRGLHLVRALAVSTGVCGDQRGRLVWADIGWTGARPVAPPLPAPPPRAARHRSVPGQTRSEAGDQAGRGHAERALATVPASRGALMADAAGA